MDNAEMISGKFLPQGWPGWITFCYMLFVMLVGILHIPAGYAYLYFTVALFAGIAEDYRLMARDGLELSRMGASLLARSRETYAEGLEAVLDSYAFAGNDSARLADTSKAGREMLAALTDKAEEQHG